MRKIASLAVAALLCLSFTPAQKNSVSGTLLQQKRLPIFVGYQSVSSITVYVSYNPSTSTILDVSAYDEFNHSIGVTEWDGSITAISGTLYATGFRVNLATSGYVVLSGYLTMV